MGDDGKSRFVDNDRVRCDQEHDNTSKRIRMARDSEVRISDKKDIERDVVRCAKMNPMKEMQWPASVVSWTDLARCIAGWADEEEAGLLGRGATSRDTFGCGEGGQN